MNPWLNYHHLYYFRVIANEGSIAKAADKLRLGQPTLSTQLKVFEDNIGVQLFERKHKKLILSESGRIALDYANGIFKMGNEMVEVLKDSMPLKRTHVQIGALDSVPKDIVYSVVKEALAAGDCTVSILEGKGDEMIRELANHRIDLFISNYSPSIHEADSLYVKPIGQVPVVICGAPKFKALRKNFPQSLHQMQFVLPTSHSKMRHDLDHYLKGQEIVVDCVTETQDVSLQLLMGRKGVGLIPIPIAVAEEYFDHDLVEIGVLPGVFENYYLVSASRKIENPISSRVMKSFAVKAN